MERTLRCDPSLALLSLLAEYHDLATRQGLPAGRDRPVRRQLIEELLLPERIQEDGVHAVPVEMALHRPAQVASEHGEVVGATLAVAINSVEVALSDERRRIKLRDPVILSIQTGWPKVWWRFQGRVTRVRGKGRTIKVRLVRSLGCMSHLEQSDCTVVPISAARSPALRRVPPIEALPA